MTNADLRFYKGLVDLLESHADEGRVPKRSEWTNSKPLLFPKNLKNADQLGWPILPHSCEIQVFCSVIHLPAVIVFLLAQHDLRPIQINLNVQFFQTSSQAVREFKKATAQNCPALVTVTDGTADILRQSPRRFGQFMEVAPVVMKLASTERIGSTKTTDLTQLQYICANHPTDLLIFERFMKKRQPEIETPVQLSLINESPESIEILANAKRNQALMVNPFMANWATASIEHLKPLFLLEGWRETEKRFIFDNRFFRHLSDTNGYSVAHWLHINLNGRFENLRRAKSDFVTNTRIGKREFTRLVRVDYFNF